MNIPVLEPIAVGKRIRDERRRNKLTVEALCELLGNLSPQAIYKWERGDSCPTVDNLLILSYIFNVSTDYILLGTSKPGDTREREDRCDIDIGPLHLCNKVGSTDILLVHDQKIQYNTIALYSSPARLLRNQFP